MCRECGWVCAVIPCPGEYCVQTGFLNSAGSGTIGLSELWCIFRTLGSWFCHKGGGEAGFWIREPAVEEE